MLDPEDYIILRFFGESGKNCKENFVTERRFFGIQNSGQNMFFRNQNSLELLTSSKRVNLWLQNEWSLATVECSSTTGQLKTSILLFERSGGRKIFLKQNEVFTPNTAPYEKPRTVADRGESTLSNNVELVALH